MLLVVEWNAKKDFRAPPAAPPTPLDAWGEICAGVVTFQRVHLRGLIRLVG